ncbi:neurobeachin-like isoform X5 [Branchiostoma floridae x Branchiostoma japonicum]
MSTQAASVTGLAAQLGLQAGGGGSGAATDVQMKTTKMKFAVLIGLIQVGEVSNRDILETVLNLLVGGKFDLEVNFIIKEPESILHMLELLDNCSTTLQAEIWSMFNAILRKSTRNLQACTEVHLIEKILQKLPSTDDMIAGEDKFYLLVDLLGVLASYSITVKELKILFGMLKGDKGTWPVHAVKLLKVLRQMPQRHGPDTFFNFTGRHGSAIALPPLAKWPYQSGFTFNSWFRMDPLNTINVDRERPYLYCFRTSKGVGYSAHFVGSCLIVTALKAKGKGFQHCVKYDFQPRKWYMVTIAHIYNRWRNSELKCYVNGKLVSFGDMAWHVNTSDTFDKCFLGSSETADADRVFCGQMGAVYVFGEVLSAHQVSAIYQLGPGYMNQFRFESESDLLLSETHKKCLYDGKLSSCIVFTYNPKATDAQLCLESSPRGNPSFFVHSPHALMLAVSTASKVVLDVRAIVTQSIHSALHSIGGIQVLFPLFAQLDHVQQNGELDYSVCSMLLGLLSDLLQSSVRTQQQMIQAKGFLVIGYLLEKATRKHITIQVLDSFLQLAKYLASLPTGGPLLRNLLDHILFNPTIWIYTPAKVQMALYTYLATEFVQSANIYNNIRRVSTVLQLMHTLKHFYWVVNPQDRSGIAPKGMDGPRPTQNEVKSLRAFMLLFMKQLILKDQGVDEDELQAILNYLLTMHEDENLHDILQLLVALMSEHPSSMIPAFDKRNGVRVIFKLLASASEGIRVQALKVMGYFLKNTNAKRKNELMQAHSLFTLLGDRLMLHTDTLSMTTYNALYEILTEQVCTQVLHVPHPEPDSSCRVHNPMIMQVVARLIKNSRATEKVLEVKKLFLSDMIKLFNNSRENRRTLLQCSVWQDWMFSLCYIHPANKDEQKVTEMVYSLFRMLLYHAMKYEYGGWRVWVDTLAIAHSKVSFENHKNQLAKAYEQYQKFDLEHGEVRSISAMSEKGTGTPPGVSPVRIVTSFPKTSSSGKTDQQAAADSSATVPSSTKPITADGNAEGSNSQANDVGGTANGVTSNVESTDKKATNGIVEQPNEVGTKSSSKTEIANDKAAATNDNTAEVAKVQASTVVSTGQSTNSSNENVLVNGEVSPVSPIQKGIITLSQSIAGSGSQGSGDSSKPEPQNLDNKATKAPANKEAASFLNSVIDNVVSRLATTETDWLSGKNLDELSTEDVAKEVAAALKQSRGSEKISDKAMQDTSAIDKVAGVEENGTTEQCSVADGQVKTVTEPNVNVEPTSEPPAVPDAVQYGVEPSAISNEKPPSEEVRTKEETVAASPISNEHSTEQAKETDMAETGAKTEDVNSEVKNSNNEAKNEASADGLTPQSTSAVEAPSSTEAKTAATPAATNGAEAAPSSEKEKSAASSEPSAATTTTAGATATAASATTTAATTAASTAGTQAEATVSPSQQPTSPASGTGSQKSQGSPGQQFSPGPRTSMFRIPEFSWSPMHQRLLSDLLFSLETDIQVWRSHSSKTVIDFVNSSENAIFVHNTIHLVSQLCDNLIIACGGILPLLASATSPSYELDVIEPSQGLTIEAAISFVHRLMNLVDVLVFASSLSFAELEVEKNMSSGGILRQCLRIICCCAVRNVLECRQKEKPSANGATIAAPDLREKNLQSLLRGAQEIAKGTGTARDPSAPFSEFSPTNFQFLNPQGPNNHPTNLAVQNLVENMAGLPGVVSMVTDAERLLQDMDINRLRAVVYRDVEDSKQAQFLCLAVVYFISVLMVSKYRDILEPTHPDLSPSEPYRRTRSAVNSPTGQPANFGNASWRAMHAANHQVMEGATTGKVGTASEGGATSAASNAKENSRIEQKNDAIKKTAEVKDVAVVPEQSSVNAKNESESAKDTAGMATSAKEISPSVLETRPSPESQYEGLDFETNVFTSENTQTLLNKEKMLDDDSPKDSMQVTQDRKEEDKKESHKPTEPSVQPTEVKPETTVTETTEEVQDQPLPVKEDKFEEIPLEEQGAAAPVTATEVKTQCVDEKKDEEDSLPTPSHVAALLRKLKAMSAEQDDKPDEEVIQAQYSPTSVVYEVTEEAHTKPAVNTKPVKWNSFDRSIVRHEPPVMNTNGISSSKTESTDQAVVIPRPPPQMGMSGGMRTRSQSTPSGFGPGSGLPRPHSFHSGFPERHNDTVTSKLERSLETVAPLLREIFLDFAQFLSRTLVGSHGQELLIEGLVCMKSSTSVVELVMMLCSQEWQNSIQKHAGLAFIELINEGRLLSHAMKDHLVRVANEAEFILNRQRVEDVQKHAEFESICAQHALERQEEEKMCDQLISAARRRDQVTATQLRQKIMNILTSKHGAWGSPKQEQPRQFWKLDYWEDDLRRRRRLVRNPHGTTHPEATLKAALEHGAPEDAVSQARQAFHKEVAAMKGRDYEILDPEELLLEEKELDELAGPVAFSTPCSLIAPAVVAKGTLSITAAELYFEVDEEDPSYKKLDPKILLYTESIHGKWHFHDIVAIFSRNYLHQRTALEIFFANRSSVMFSFPDQATVKKVVYALPRVGVGVNYGLPQARRVSLATPKQLFRMSNMTARWQRREISNFEYLMFVSTIAGRTYNDLNQYPVFPWVLTNYESEELDLTLPSNFRDLSKPVGALNPKRRSFFQERYEAWDDPDVSAFHYGTHYSTAGFVLNFLIRLEPFTTMFLNLQGNKFDHANRTFSNILQTWRNCQRDTSDVKELIPEFYYLPEMLMNMNGYNMGTMEDSRPVDHVVLPAWARTPEEFIRLNRMALESEFVSCQLHQWIDLIFGYKQKGPEAIRATNMFYYLTYEGSVNLDSISDPVMKEAIKDQIKSFGVTPCQLLTEPHPPRSSAMHLTPMMFTDMRTNDVLVALKFPSNSPIIHLTANTHPHVPIPAVTTVTANLLFSINKWNASAATFRGAPGYSLEPNQYAIEVDPLILAGTGVHRRQVNDILDQSIQLNSCCCRLTSDNRHILICGFWDKSFRIYSTDSGRLLQVVYGHWDVVTCLARSECYIGGDCYIVSGSRDATLLLWFWSSRLQAITGEPHNSNRVERAIPKTIMTGHETEVLSACVSAELGLVISCSRGGPVLVHTINGDLLRSLDPPEFCVNPTLVKMSCEGQVVVSYDKGHLSLFTFNGKFLRAMELNDNILSMVLSADGQYLVTGGDNRIVEVWQTSNFKLLYTFPGVDSSVRALDLTHDQKTVLVGLSSGSLVAFNIDFNRWHYEFQARY